MVNLHLNTISPTVGSSNWGPTTLDTVAIAAIGLMLKNGKWMGAQCK